ADALQRPIDDPPGRQLVVHRLPEEIAGFLVEANEDALVAFDRGVARVLVVGADKDLAAGDDRPAVGAGTQLLDPFDVLLFFNVPIRSDVLLEGVNEIALHGATKERPGVLAGLARGFFGL